MKASLIRAAHKSRAEAFSAILQKLNTLSCVVCSYEPIQQLYPVRASLSAGAVVILWVTAVLLSLRCSRPKPL
jgi:hypothetical protein